MRFLFLSLTGFFLLVSTAANASSPQILRQFASGVAGRLTYEQMVAGGAFIEYPMRGGTFERADSVQYIVLHSTETASPADARRVIRSWSNRGLRHPGAQFVVDRDGTIYSTVNPDKMTVHVDTSRTLSGFTNDNTVGIEMVRSGKQKYSTSQLQSVARLVDYLQSHYDLPDESVTTHGHIQPADRSDPVNFDMDDFLRRKVALRKNEPPDIIAMPRPAPDFRAQVPAAPSTAPSPAPELERKQSND